MSLSVTWCEHENTLRINDSLGDEVEAYFGDDAEILLNHRAFGESFQVECGMLTEFDHSNREILSWSYNVYNRQLKDVLQLLALRRSILRSVSQRLEQHLASAVRSVLDPTKLSALSADFIPDALQSHACALEEPIMIHYLHYVLARFDDDDRLEPDFYRDGINGFEEYLLNAEMA